MDNTETVNFPTETPVRKVSFDIEPVWNSVPYKARESARRVP